MKGGFDPALAYTLAFTAKNPKVFGIGLAATRDLVAFLRYDAQQPPIRWRARCAGRSAAASPSRAIILRSLIHLGFNTAEDGRIVFDGLNPIVGPRMLSMNHRFATPGGLVGLYELGSDGPNWWSSYNDTARGAGPSQPARPLPEADNHCPKIAEIFGSTEFWDLRASPILSAPTRSADIPLPANVRRYYNAGAPHNGGRGGFDLVTPPHRGLCAELQSQSGLRHQPAVFAGAGGLGDQGHRAAAQHLSDAWRPATLVTPAAYDKAFPEDCRRAAAGLFSPLYQYDLGKGFDYADMTRRHQHGAAAHRQDHSATDAAHRCRRQ